MRDSINIWDHLSGTKLVSFRHQNCNTNCWLNLWVNRSRSFLSLTRPKVQSVTFGGYRRDITDTIQDRNETKIFSFFLLLFFSSFTAPACAISGLLHCPSLYNFRVPSLPQPVQFPGSFTAPACTIFGLLYCPSLYNFRAPSLPQPVQFPGSFTAPACTISGLLHCPSLYNFRAGKCTHTRLKTVYLMGPVTSLLSVLCILIEVLSCAHANGWVVGGGGGEGVRRALII